MVCATPLWRRQTIKMQLTRFHLLKLVRWQWVAALALCLTAIPHLVYAQPTKKPNVLYIIADDLGWKDVGFHGSDIKTPNIDKLAETGARLEQFYVQPMCTPTRACLMTGRYPLRYGLQTAVAADPAVAIRINVVQSRCSRSVLK